jgi:hypothetical protein
VTKLLAGLRGETPPAVPYDMAKAAKAAVEPAQTQPAQTQPAETEPAETETRPT